MALILREDFFLTKNRLCSSPQCRRGRMSSLKSLIFVTWLMVFVPYAFGQATAERQAPAKPQSPVKVAILPVAIHSPEDLAYMQEGLLDMLSSRVELNGRVAVLEKGVVKKALSETSGEMDSEAARNLGQTVGADFVVFGSLTKLGDSCSLDLKVVEVKGEKPSASVYVHAKKMEEIIAKVDDLARKVDEKVLGYSLTPPLAEKPAEASKVEAPKEVAALPVPVPPPISSRPISPAAPEKSPSFGRLWQSKPFPFKIIGMAIGDLDGDGRKEIALIDERNLYIYRWEKEDFKLLKKLEGGKFDQYLAVDVADLEKEGKAKVFVTNLQKDRLASFVVASVDGNFKMISSGLDWYLKAVSWGERGTVLLGQKKGENEAFQWPIYEMGWDGKQYKEIRRAELPKIYSIYGFIPFTDEGKTYFLYLDANFRLKATDGKGKVIWTSKADYGSDNSFRVKPFSSTTTAGADDMAFLNVRILARGKEIFLIRNISPAGQILKRTKYYSGGEVQVLNWSGAVFMETWKSQEIAGYVADFQVEDIDGGQGEELIVAVNIPKESIFSVEKNSALLVTRIQ